MLRFATLCALAAAASAAGTAWDGEAGKVKFVSDDEFATFKKENPKFLGFFFAPWCGHCKAAKPFFAEASNTAPLPMVAVDCTSYGKKTCGENGVSGYPTIKFFDGDSEPEDYQGARTKLGFLKFMATKDEDYEVPKEELVIDWGEGAKGKVQFVDDESFDKYKEETPKFLAFFFAPWCGHCKAAKPHYAEASEQVKIPMVAFDCTSWASKTCGKYEVKGYPTIKFFDSEKDAPQDYSGARTKNGFAKFLNKKDPDYVPPPFENTAPEGWEDTARIIHMVDDHFEAFREKHTRFLTFFYAPWCGHCKNAKPDYRDASTRFHVRTFPFVAMDCTGDGQETCGKFNVTSFPQFMYFDKEAEAKEEEVFKTSERSSGDFINFVEAKLNQVAMKGAGEKPTRATLKKMRVRQLRKMLKARGQKCRGCTEKSHFVDRVLQVLDMPVVEKKKTVKKHRKTLMQEKQEKAAKKAAEVGWSKEDHGNGEVVHAYTEDDLEAHVTKAAPHGVLAMFFAPWCGHCKTQKPHLVKASSAVKEIMDGIDDAEYKASAFVAVDCDVAKDLCFKYSVKSFPTYKWIPKAGTKPADCGGMDGGRDENGFTKWTMAKLVPSWKKPVGPFVNKGRWSDTGNGKVVFMDDDHFAEFREENKQFLAFFYAPWCGHCKAAKPHYAKASESFEVGTTKMVAMDCTSDGSATCSEFDVSGYPTIKWIDGKDVSDYTESRDEAGFKKFIQKQKSSA